MKAEVFLRLSERIRKDAGFKKIERILDDSESFNFVTLIENEKESFDEYLRFYDSVVLLEVPAQFTRPEADMLFARPSELLKRHYFVRNYIADENYKNLDAVLKLSENADKK
jgi:hypothetical protein